MSLSGKLKAMGIIAEAKQRGPIEKIGTFSSFNGETSKQKVWFTDKEIAQLSKFSLDPSIALALIELGEDNYDIIDKTFQDDPEFLSASLDINPAITSKLSAKKMKEVKQFILDNKAKYVKFVGSEEKARDNFTYLEKELESEEERILKTRKKIKSFLDEFYQVSQGTSESV